MKDTKLKIKMDYEKLSQEEINSHKDFNKLHKSYTQVKTNWYKSPKKLGAITSVVVTVTVVVTVGVWKYTGKTTHTSSKKSTPVAATKATPPAPKQVQHTTRFVNPPISGIDIPYKSYNVKAEKGAELKYGNGSKISIPKNAFCDKNGKDVKGDVTIQYREFHNPVDFFLSGIPMTYDSAGKQYTFESAGMLDIKGFKDGEPVIIKQGKNIQVIMPSCGKGDKYNTYALDTVQGKWVYIEKSKILISSKTIATTHPSDSLANHAEQKEVIVAKNEVAKLQQEEKNLEKTKPLQPQKASQASYSFDINADPKEFPEMAAYKNVLFQVDANDKSFDPKYTKTTWDDATLKRNGTSNHYTFNVKKGEESHTFIVYPVFEGKNYDAAMTEYDKKYHEYETALNDRIAEEKKKEEEYTALVKKMEEDAKKAELVNNSKVGIMNVLTVNKFSIYNCDCPDKCPSGTELAAKYVDQSRQDINTECLYLVEFGRNAIFKYYPGKPITFNPRVDNMVWCVTKDDKVAIYTKENFKEITQTSGKYTFVMHTQPATFKTTEEAQAFFKSYM